MSDHEEVRMTEQMDGCTLQDLEMAGRMAAWGAAFQMLASRQHTAAGFVLRFTPEAESEVRRLAALEGDCCQSLRFLVRREDDHVRMDVEGPWEDTPWRMAMPEATA